ncbi:HMG-box [Cubamyces sp. BRFM 1775]|nr:HMG-box [Cubamyces sp. BRFM 1775]
MAPTTTGKSRKAAQQPPRPPNAWLIYRSEKVKELLQRLPEGAVLHQSEASRFIGPMWASEPREVRAEFERRAEAAKEEHARLYPGYRYQPMPKAERERRRLGAKAAKFKARATRAGGRKVAELEQSREESIPQSDAQSEAGPSGSSEGGSVASEWDDATSVEKEDWLVDYAEPDHTFYIMDDATTRAVSSSLPWYVEDCPGYADASAKGPEAGGLPSAPASSTLAIDGWYDKGQNVLDCEASGSDYNGSLGYSSEDWDVVSASSHCD